jgi:hypothetical protein
MLRSEALFQIQALERQVALREEKLAQVSVLCDKLLRYFKDSPAAQHDVAESPQETSEGWRTLQEMPEGGRTLQGFLITLDSLVRVSDSDLRNNGIIPSHSGYYCYNCKCHTPSKISAVQHALGKKHQNRL